MNYRIIQNYLETHCHCCNKWLELGELIYKDDCLYCLYCGKLLGYIHDLPDKFREDVIR